MKRLLLGGAGAAKTKARSFSPSNPSVSSTFHPDQDYTNRRISGFWLFGNHYSARSFHDVLVGCARELRKAHGQAFEQTAVKLRGTKRVYFSRNPGELKKPEDLGGGLFVETNLNANILVGICRALMKNLGHNPDDFRPDVL